MNTAQSRPTEGPVPSRASEKIGKSEQHIRGAKAGVSPREFSPEFCLQF